jgi:hypothetical protein
MPDVLPPAPPEFGSPSPAQAPPSQEGNGIAVAGLVVGILALVLCWVMVVNFILGVLGIVFGAVGMAKAKRIGGKNRGMALAGLITGILGIVSGVVIFFVVLAAFKDYAAGGKRTVARFEIETIVNMDYPTWAMQHPDKACPSSLAELGTNTVDPWGHEYKMVCGPDAPSGVKGLGVYSVGEDGKEGTSDDLKSWGRR